MCPSCLHLSGAGVSTQDSGRLPLGGTHSALGESNGHPLPLSTQRMQFLLLGAPTHRVERLDLKGPAVYTVYRCTPLSIVPARARGLRLGGGGQATAGAGALLLNAPCTAAPGPLP
jgi:hypothetical protein